MANVAIMFGRAWAQGLRTGKNVDAVIRRCRERRAVQSGVVIGKRCALFWVRIGTAAVDSQQVSPAQSSVVMPRTQATVSLRLPILFHVSIFDCTKIWSFVFQYNRLHIGSRPVYRSLVSTRHNEDYRL